MFDLRDQLADAFRQYVYGAMRMERDNPVIEKLRAELDAGVLWPDPLLQLNPRFALGPRIGELVTHGVLHRRCEQLFRRNKRDGYPGDEMQLHQHQYEALRAAQSGANYVLTTGTGSGKSLAYILPIVDYVLKQGAPSGIHAVVVYPMNALANSQCNELEGYLGKSDAPGCAVRYQRYTGQEDQAERDAIIRNPPHILLTNYMMLELMLTRPYESRLIEHMKDLRFLVLDELHTYRGRQGADVALLVRRLSQRSGSDRIQYVGTSATMSTEGGLQERSSKVAEVASLLFGAPVQPKHIITETLIRWTPDQAIDTPEFIQALTHAIHNDLPDTEEAIRNHPLTIWLESEAGLETREGVLVRRQPRPLTGPDGLSRDLALLTGVSEEQAAAAIKGLLSRPLAEGGRHPFAVRLHQFFSPGTGVYGTMEPADRMFCSVEWLKTSPEGEPLFPLAFCRHCGQRYYLVSRNKDTGELLPRPISERCQEDDWEEGYVFLPDEGGFPDWNELIPEEWINPTNGRLISKHKQHKPEPIELPSGDAAWFLPYPFRLCVNSECRFTPPPQQSNERISLSTLGLYGRSTATTVLGMKAIQHLQQDSVMRERKADKLLSFTDNRQDASLQAGHFNDMVNVLLIRTALCSALQQNDMLDDANVTAAVEQQLRLEPEELMNISDGARPLPRQLDRARQALKQLLGYRIYSDLRGEWKYTMATPEDVGLMHVAYPDLEEICSDAERWRHVQPILRQLTPDQRWMLTQQFLELLRLKRAIDTPYLKYDEIQSMAQQVDQLLHPFWSIDLGRTPAAANAFVITAHNVPTAVEAERLSERSRFGRWTRDKLRVWTGEFIAEDTLLAVLHDLARVLTRAGQLVDVPALARDSVIPFRLAAQAMVWKRGYASWPDERTKPLTRKPIDNTFFRDLYSTDPTALKGLIAREHTAQVKAELREEREVQFRQAAIKMLCCSPTMELGVDIADLNVVNLRNVPPTPANYAQRSGRAGRSGQPALVYTYCTAGSPHDQYYFRQPVDMVAGVVSPPRIDLANEDLVRAHIQAIWLGEARLDLGHRVSDMLLDLADKTNPVLSAEALERLRNPSVLSRTRQAASALLDALGAELTRARWFHDRWLDEALDGLQAELDGACNRWRSLYRAAYQQHEEQSKRERDQSGDEKAHKQASLLRHEAGEQLKMLQEGKNRFSSDFYVYRYLASEGFLPGYSFPRLPLSAWLPGDSRRNKQNEHLSRPRFVAISEFGPGAVVYHEGSRYIVERIHVSSEERQQDGKLLTSLAKLCPNCGYCHPGERARTADVCERCGKEFNACSLLQDMVRLQAVSLKRRDRISCDEEERMRQGFEVQTALRFTPRSGEPVCDIAIGQPTEELRVTLTYAQAATIYRINVGWNRRRDDAHKGYPLDTTRMAWVPDEKTNELAKEALENPDNNPTQIIIPYVDDRRNALLIEWSTTPDPAVMAGLQAALKSAIQSVFQLEDSELAVEPLPSRDTRNLILLYEAAEGGAGVLRRLVNEPDALARCARRALEICHFDPDTLEDRHRAPHARLDCREACYDCLLSYSNQRDHPMLNRHLLLGPLAALRDIRVTMQPNGIAPDDHFAALAALCDSNLERDWLNLLQLHGLRPPSEAQYRIPAAHTVADFVYLNTRPHVAVYIDGPSHDSERRSALDAEQEEALLMEGWVVHRFRYDADWEALLRENPSTYGEWR